VLRVAETAVHSRRIPRDWIIRNITVGVAGLDGMGLGMGHGKF
jgi:hypothetical protein